MRTCSGSPVTASRADRVDDRQAGAHRPLGIVLMRFAASRNRSSTPSPMYLAMKPSKLADRRRRQRVVGADDLAQILGIEPRRQRGRADQIAEHHGELPALAPLAPVP